MHIISTIIPIFAIIILGWFARRKGFIQPEFLGPANRLVYHIAIPAMIFRSIAGASLKAHVNAAVLSITLICILIIFASAWVAGKIVGARQGQLGSFIHSTFHGNLGYIGLAVAYYALGNQGLIRAGIIAGFMMIMQNLLGVIALQLYSDNSFVNQKKLTVILKILGNPVIVSAMAGILFSLADIPLPLVINRTLEILGDLALPMALLIIGASLSFEMMRKRMRYVLSSGLMKLILLPGLGLVLFKLFGVPTPDYLPGHILLASPTATITYVMAKEMNGDPDFATAAISTSTMLSAITFSVWLNFAG